MLIEPSRYTLYHLYHEFSDHCSRWGFPKIEVPKNHPNFYGTFHKASSGVTPMTSMTFPLIYLHCQPFSSNSHRSCLKCGITRKSSKPLSTILVLKPMFLYWIHHFKRTPHMATSPSMFTCTLPLEALDAFTPTSSLSSWGWSCDFFRTKHMWRGWDIDAVTATPNKIET